MTLRTFANSAVPVAQPTTPDLTASLPVPVAWTVTTVPTPVLQSWTTTLQPQATLPGSQPPTLYQLWPRGRPNA